MNSTGLPISPGNHSHTAILDPVADKTSALPNLAPSARTATAPPIPSKRIGYGLPCAHCGSYYAADLKACPFCKAKERILPAALISGTAPAATGAANNGSPTTEDRQRENTLRELKSQAYAAHTQSGAAASLFCSHQEKHLAAPATAAVCQGCYDTAQNNAKSAEAALAISVEEASQLIYDAVWADPSDPTKTYLNAAQAILGELRKRAGINA